MTDPAVKAKRGSAKTSKTGATKTKTAASSHPTFQQMIKKAISELKERNGSSRQAIAKYILANYKMDQGARFNHQLRNALNKSVTGGHLKQSKGTGAAGSFRIGESKMAKKTKKVAVKKAATGKPKKTGVKKSATKKTATGSATKTKKRAPVKKAASGAKKATKKAGVTKKTVAGGAKKTATKAKKVAAAPKKTATAKPKVAKAPKKPATTKA